MKNTTLSTDEFFNLISMISKLDSYKTPGITPAMKSTDFQFLFLLAYLCALRVSEVINLKKSDFDLENKLLKIRKKNKNEFTTIPPNLSAELHDYLKNLDNEDYLFVSQKTGKPLNRQVVWSYAKNAGKLSGAKLFKVTKQKNLEGMQTAFFREFYARYMLKKGADPNLVELKLRNSSDNNYGNYTLNDLKNWEKYQILELLSDDDIQKYSNWYKKNISVYHDLVDESKRIIEKNLKIKNITVQDIRERVKSIESFENKLRRGVHYKPENMQDLAGIRIICFVNSDVDKVGELITSIFSVDKTRTKDRKKILNDNKMGYSSIQFVCVLPHSRTKHSENRHLKGRFFEIQVRTILQHAWSAIEHDDVYKNTELSNTELKRQFNLVSSILELADNELERLHTKTMNPD